MNALRALCCKPEVADRFMVLVPALHALAGGCAPTAVQQLRRNVALHSDAQNLFLLEQQQSG